MTTSNNGINFIKKFEGLQLAAYKAVPSEKYYTIGYGHYGPDVSPTSIITEKQAETLLKNDLIEAEEAVNKYASLYNLNQNQFDALVSFTFNCGVGNLNKLVDKGNRSIDVIKIKLLSYNKSGGKELKGLTRRRKEELDLFNTPVTSSSVSVEIKEDRDVMILATSLNVRQGAGTQYKKVAKVYKNDILNIKKIIKKDNNVWGQIGDKKYIALIHKGEINAIYYAKHNIREYYLNTEKNYKLDKNFKVGEFACKDGNFTCLIDDKLVAFLQFIRDYYGKPVKINSGYRTASYNKKVGGAGKSKHLIGQAADISIKGVTPKDIARLAEDMGILGIGLYDNFVHIDTRDSKSFWYSSRQIKYTTFK